MEGFAEIDDRYPEQYKSDKAWCLRVLPLDTRLRLFTSRWLETVPFVPVKKCDFQEECRAIIKNAASNTAIYMSARPLEEPDLSRWAKRLCGRCERKAEECTAHYLGQAWDCLPKVLTDDISLEWDLATWGDIDVRQHEDQVSKTHIFTGKED